MSQVWSDLKEILVIVQPDTVARWHRKGFRLYWRSISKRGPGRPSKAQVVGIPKVGGLHHRYEWQDAA